MIYHCQMENEKALIPQLDSTHKVGILRIGSILVSRCITIQEDYGQGMQNYLCFYLGWTKRNRMMTNGYVEGKWGNNAKGHPNNGSGRNDMMNNWSLEINAILVGGMDETKECTRQKPQ